MILFNFRYLHIFLAFLDQILFASQLPKASYQFRVCSKFLKKKIKTQCCHSVVKGKPNSFVYFFFTISVHCIITFSDYSTIANQHLPSIFHTKKYITWFK